jgi:hypothetical protein
MNKPPEFFSSANLNYFEEEYDENIPHFKNPTYENWWYLVTKEHIQKLQKPYYDGLRAYFLYKLVSNS